MAPTCDVPAFQKRTGAPSVAHRFRISLNLHYTCIPWFLGINPYLWLPTPPACRKCAIRITAHVDADKPCGVLARGFIRLRPATSWLSLRMFSSIASGATACRCQAGVLLLPANGMDGSPTLPRTSVAGVEGESSHRDRGFGNWLGEERLSAARHRAAGRTMYRRWVSRD